MKLLISLFLLLGALLSTATAAVTFGVNGQYDSEFIVTIGAKGPLVQIQLNGVSGTATYKWQRSDDLGDTWADMTLPSDRLMFYGNAQLLWKSSSNGAQRSDRAFYRMKVTDNTGTYYGPNQELSVDEPEVVSVATLRFYNASDVELSSYTSVDHPSKFKEDYVFQWPTGATYVKAGIYVATGVGPYRYMCRLFPPLADMLADSSVVSQPLAGYSTADTTSTTWETTITKTSQSGNKMYCLEVATPDQFDSTHNYGTLAQRLGYGNKVFILAH